MMVLPYSQEQAAAWRRRDADGIEPLTLHLPGFTVTERGSLPNQRVFVYSHPMAIDSTRKVMTSAGDTLEVHTACPFEWFPRTVQVIFVNGPSFTGRVVFINCAPATVNDAIARLSIRLGESTDKHSGPYR
jgi:hypothetical protein